MKAVQKYTLLFSGICGLALLGSLIFGFHDLTGLLAVSGMTCFALGLGAITSMKSYQYTAWIILAIVCGMIYPNTFLKFGDFDLRNKWLILIVVQLVMFGMGAQMKLKDFSGIKTMGKGVLVGLLSQFTVMPLLGFGLTKLFDFPPEIAAGVILIGSCSSGLASNVMVYIAGANLTLSVTLTAVATLMAPLMTPLLMQLLAGTYIEIKFFDMCMQIIKIVIVPIGAAMIYDGMKTLGERFRKHTYVVGAIMMLVLLMILFISVPESKPLAMFLEMTGFIAGAIIFGIIFYHLTTLFVLLPDYMPFFSMFGIVYFTLVTTAASQQNILQIGFWLVLVAIIHNSLGYLLGYNFSRILGMDKNSARTIALEVGLQNGGMASGLAGVMGKLATLGLASAVFSPWMNISGSVLANFWKRRK